MWALGHFRVSEGWKYRQLGSCFGSDLIEFFTMESSILAQNERWRRGLGMQVERESEFIRE